MVGQLKQDNPIARRDELEGFVLRHLKLAKRPLSEKELIAKSIVNTMKYYPLM